MIISIVILVFAFAVIILSIAYKGLNERYKLLKSDYDNHETKRESLIKSNEELQFQFDKSIGEIKRVENEVKRIEGLFHEKAGAFNQISSLYSHLGTIHKEACEKYQNFINELIEKHAGEIKAAREDANSTQRVVIRGKLAEE